MTRRLIAPLLVAACLVVRPSEGFANASASTAEHRDAHPATLHHKAVVRHERRDGSPPVIQLAITVDDLPGGGPEVLGHTHVQMVKEIIAALQAHRVPRPIGFVVGEMLDFDPARTEAIDAWLSAGFLVGNHTYSHDHVSELGLQGYMADILKNRPLIDSLEKRSGQRQSYFRFPYLEEGATHEEREALWNLLQAQHYTLVRPSVTFSDTDWADAYLRCSEQRDAQSLEALDHSYLANAIGHLRWSVVASKTVFGREIPLILMLHVNMPTAKNLDELLKAYEAEGVQFVPVEDALREPAYATHYDVPGGGLLDQASLHLRRPHPQELLDPMVLIDRVCPEASDAR
jgi:peptidoglycan/xylan/chitin deacetylase (PgdA/CDA1 family)